MESINPVSTNLVQNYQAQQTQNGVTTPPSMEPVQPEIAQDILSKEAADASKAYAASMINSAPKENTENSVEEQSPVAETTEATVTTEETAENNVQ